MKKWQWWIILCLLSFFCFLLLTKDWLIAAGILIMVGFHEGGHLWAAKLVGARAEGFYFLPIGGISLVDVHPPERWKRFIIALGGPLVGFILCSIGVSVFTRFNLEILRPVLVIWVVINMFNLLPIYPLDGGRIIYQALANNQESSIKHVGNLVFWLSWIATAFVLLLTSSFMLLIIVCFLNSIWGRIHKDDLVGWPMTFWQKAEAWFLYWVILIAHVLLLGYVVPLSIS